MSDQPNDTPLTNASTYLVALISHAQCMDKDLIARIRCDNTADPVYWCEVADPVTCDWAVAMM